MNSIPLRITHATTTISRLGGGLFESVRYLSQETQKNGVLVDVVALEDEYTHADRGRWAPLNVHTFPVVGPARFAYSPEILPHLVRSEPDVVHLHGVWQYPTSAVLRWAIATRRPYVVSAHGMLEPWALQRSRFKKAMVNWLYQDTCLRGASCLRATAASEVESIRQLGLRNPVAIIPNGVPIPDTLPVRASVEGRKKRALFLSRIHPKKGLPDLVRAWRSVNPPDWELVLVGPDEGGHLGEVMNLVRECHLEDSISYGGEFWTQDAKLQCYYDADLFILPSYSENFGLVIAEALGCGVPVITTHATPWKDLETFRCGWWIATGEASLADALREAIRVSPDELHAMGQRGRSLVQQKYSWAPMGVQMAEVYAWLMGQADAPGYVVMGNE